MFQSVQTNIHNSQPINTLNPCRFLRLSFFSSLFFTLLFTTLLGLLAFRPLAAAESFVIVDSTSGCVLAQEDGQRKLPIATLTTIATAMVTLDWAQLKHLDLNTLVTVPPAAMSSGRRSASGHAKTALHTGDQLSLRDLLYAMLMASDEGAADTLAFHIGRQLPNPERLPSEKNFVAHMNALARQLKMQRTRFLNPTGQDEEEHPFSTAIDLAILTRYAYSKSAFPFYVAQKQREIHILRQSQPIVLQLINTNQLLGQEGIDGVKTGRSPQAGQCILLTSTRPPQSVREGEKVYITPRRILAVLLDSPDRYREGLEKVRYGWQLYDQWAADHRPLAPNTLLP